MKNKRGFTLVELLAVIVILAIILVISIPKITSVIENAKLGSMESTAKMVASSAEREYQVRETLEEPTSGITCNNVASISNTDYSSCTLEFNNGVATVTVVGSGKFSGYACVGDKNNVTCSETDAYMITYNLDGGAASNPESYTVLTEDFTLVNPTKTNYTFTGWTEGESTTKNMTVTIERGSTGAKVYTAHYEANAVSLIEVLNTVGNTEGLMEDETPDQNLRYVGANPNNYVKFNGTNDQWRIIGIFDVKTSLEGQTEKRIKLIGPSIGDYSWDSSASTVNSGYGVNDWVNSDLNNLLNNLYYNGTSGTCYNGFSNASTPCNFSTNTLNVDAKDMIDDAVWHLGAPIYTPNSPPYGAPTLTFYQAERGTEVSEVGRPTTHTARIGLIYPSDYGYASTDADCRNDMRSGITYDDSNYNYTNQKCRASNNWLVIGSGYWTISSNRSFANLSYFVDSGGHVGAISAGTMIPARPVVYLKAGVKIISGDGTSGANAYELSMS